MKAQPPAAAPEVLQQIGQIARQLHDTLEQLGLMPQLQQSAHELPDVRSRLGYVASKSGEAAERVLNAVECAKSEHTALQAAARGMAQRCGAGAPAALPAPQVLAFACTVEAAAARIDRQLTDILLAQDFHDLTGQVVAKVVALVIDVEASLLQLLVQAAAAPARATQPPAQPGPGLAARAGADVVRDQREVDELLAGLGF